MSAAEEALALICNRTASILKWVTAVRWSGSAAACLLFNARQTPNPSTITGVIVVRLNSPTHRSYSFERFERARARFAAFRSLRNLSSSPVMHFSSHHFEGARPVICLYTVFCGRRGKSMKLAPRNGITDISPRLREWCLSGWKREAEKQFPRLFFARVFRESPFWLEDLFNGTDSLSYVSPEKTRIPFICGILCLHGPWAGPNVVLKSFIGIKASTGDVYPKWFLLVVVTREM